MIFQFTRVKLLVVTMVTRDNYGYHGVTIATIGFRITIVTISIFRMAVGDWEADWDRNVMVCIEDGEPCYIMYRLEKNR